MLGAELGTRVWKAEENKWSLPSWSFQSSGSKQIIAQISALLHIIINAIEGKSRVLWRGTLCGSRIKEDLLRKWLGAIPEGGLPIRLGGRACAKNCEENRVICFRNGH